MYSNKHKILTCMKLSWTGGGGAGVWPIMTSTCTYLKVVVEVLQVGLVGCQLVNADLTRFIKLGWNYMYMYT